MKRFLGLGLGLWITIAFLVFIFYVPWSIAEDIHVPGDFSGIQAAIDASEDADVIIVHPGIYYENIDFMGKKIVLRSMDPSDPNLVAATVIDGKGVDSVVKFIKTEDNNSILYGFTVQNGKAHSGGGIYCKGSCPRIINVIISCNSAFYGGGIHCEDSSCPRITNTTINGNSANYSGGGIYSKGSSPHLTNATIKDNTATDGGGIYCYRSSPSISNTTISSNSAKYYGGGICCSESSLHLTNATINDNSAQYYGGGIYCDGSSPRIKNTTIYSNLATYGGGMCCEESSPSIINATISGNSAKYYGGGMCCYDSFTDIKNSILWNNSPEEILILGGASTVTYSNIKGRYPGDGNISADPLFIDPMKGDFHLSPYSACIDKGDPNSSILEDKEGILRPQDGNRDGIAQCDIGAYEYMYLCYLKEEVCDGIDNDCDDLIDEDFDTDGDGFANCGGDCNDEDPNINPSAREIYNGIDDDCDGAIDEGFQAKIHVPGDFFTIQAAIDAVEDADVVIVHLGTYRENIDFMGKGITLRSMDPNDPNVIAATIIDGKGSDSVVKFRRGEDSNSILTGFTVKNGNAYFGGGIFCYCSSPSIRNCIISGNSANEGGGIYSDDSSLSIINSTISGNSAEYGAGICCDNSSPSIINSIINSNSASDGGGIFCYHSLLSIINSTISGNSATYDGGGLYCYNCSPVITNSILWNDSPEEILVLEGTPAITYSNIQSIYPGEGNISEDPLFIDPMTGDFHLSPYSACIDKGDPDSLILEDKEGVPRPLDGNGDGIAQYDMGAYEYGIFY